MGDHALFKAQELRRAVAEQDVKTITRTPGIGPKVAGRMLLELGGKLPAPAAPAGPIGAVAAAPSGVDADVAEALVGLGWAEKAAVGAVEAVRAADGEALGAAELLRRASACTRATSSAKANGLVR